MGCRVPLIEMLTSDSEVAPETIAGGLSISLEVKVIVYVTSRAKELISTLLGGRALDLPSSQVQAASAENRSNSGLRRG